MASATGKGTGCASRSALIWQMYKSRPLAERFWEKVLKTDTCWVWTAAKYPNGYGVIGVGKKPSGDSIMKAAHRLSWELANGPIPDGLWVLHKCDNRPCVRPDHLFLGTAHDNNQDTWDKKRRRFVPREQTGELNPNSKWTDAEVADMIRRTIVGESAKSIAARYCMDRRTLWAITKRKRLPL